MTNSNTTAPAQPAASRPPRARMSTRKRRATSRVATAAAPAATAPELQPLSWDSELFNSFSDSEIGSPSIRSVDNHREIWNRLCWALQHAQTFEEFTAFTATIGAWVSSLMATDPDVLRIFAGFDVELRPRINLLPSGRNVEDVSRRRTELDGKGRIHLYLSTDEAEVGDKTVAALAVYQIRAKSLFRHGSQLVMVAGGRLHRMEESQMRALLTRACRFLTLAGDPGSKHWQNAHPPAWLVKDLVARQDWPGIPDIRGVVSYPVFLADGRVLCTAGYDATAQIYVLPDCMSVLVPDAPTLEDARNASAFIYEEMFKDFPIIQRESASVMLAALLTVVARYAIQGPCPGFLLDGNAPGVGKGKLCQTISIIATGKETTAIAPESRHDEWRKRIVSILRDAEPMALIDNIAGAFGAPALDGVLTATEWGDRELGTSTNWRGPAICVWFFTANNIRLQGDLVRRLLPMRIVSSEERPDTRSQFRHPDLLAAAKRMRPQLLQACFTILRAWHRARMPDMGLPAYGSYESWSQVVRHCVVWCGWGDPRIAADYLREQPDENDSLFKIILTNWYQLQTALAAPPTAPIAGVYAACAARHQGGSLGLTLQELLTLPEFVVGKAAISEAIQGLFQDGNLPTPHRLGIRFHAWKDRVFSGLCLSTRIVQGTTYWWVQVRPSQTR